MSVSLYTQTQHCFRPCLISSNQTKPKLNPIQTKPNPTRIKPNPIPTQTKPKSNQLKPKSDPVQIKPAWELWPDIGVPPGDCSLPIQQATLLNLKLTPFSLQSWFLFTPQPLTPCFWPSNKQSDLCSHQTPITSPFMICHTSKPSTMYVSIEKFFSESPNAL